MSQCVFRPRGGGAIVTKSTPYACSPKHSSKTIEISSSSLEHCHLLPIRSQFGIVLQGRPSKHSDHVKAWGFQSPDVIMLLKVTKTGLIGNIETLSICPRISRCCELHIWCSYSLELQTSNTIPNPSPSPWMAPEIKGRSGTGDDHHPCLKPQGGRSPSHSFQTSHLACCSGTSSTG